MMIHRSHVSLLERYGALRRIRNPPKVLRSHSSASTSEHQFHETASAWCHTGTCPILAIFFVSLCEYMNLNEIPYKPDFWFDVSVVRVADTTP